jgi:hypothetical protein
MPGQSFNIQSTEGGYNWSSTASAPGSQTSGFACYGDCTYSYTMSVAADFGSSPMARFLGSLFSWQDSGAAQIHAQDTGYYGCIGNKMIPFKGLLAAAGAKAVEEAATRGAEHGGGTFAARAYYGLTDARCTAWGSSSKVLVPHAAANIAKVAKVASGVGWAVTDAELAEAIDACSANLSGHKE